MNRVFSKINQAGLQGLEDPLNYRRVLFINNLSLVSFIVTLLVTLLIFIEGIYPQYIVTFIGGIFFCLPIYLNRARQYFLARASFLAISIGILIVACFLAYRQGRFNDLENILIGFMAVNYLLYDGKFRYIGFLLIYAVLIWMKTIKQGYIGDPYDLNFYLTIQNVSILCLTIFLFADAFRKSLLKAFVRLKEKDEILYSMIDNVPIYIALFDQKQKYKMVNLNYEKSFGKTREEIIGSHIKNVLPDNILEKHIPLIERALKGENTEFLELATLPDGSAFYAGGEYTPIVSEEGEITGVSVFVSDVTKLEEAKNNLEAANSTKDKLFSIIAHDIRGPLDLFEGLLDYSSHGILSQEDFFKHQNKVREKLTDLRETVNTLLEWARTQLAGVNTNPALTNIHEVVASNIELYKDLIEQKNINVQVEIPTETMGWLDTNHLKIGVRNIIHNSLKFTEKEGKVTIRAFEEEENVVLEIEDTGLGMDKSKVNSILKKELQHSKSGTAGEAGTGLGLSLSLELLEKNNCQVKINSKPGVGTTTSISMLTVGRDH